MYYDPYSNLPEEEPAEGGTPAESRYISQQPMFVPYGAFPQPPQPELPRKKKRFWPKAVALCLVCAILGGAGGFAGGFLASRGGLVGNAATVYRSDREPTVVSITHTNTGKELTLEEIYASWVDSTVGIRTEIVTTNYFGQTVSAAAGSGFIISADGYIVTNYHVIDGASTIKVAFNDGTEYAAELVGGEEVNDVAVLKIEAEGLTPVIIGDSDALHVGQTVTAIGNPLGELTFSQTHGIVSALNRTITMSDGTRMNMIQTDCTINSGNSGGPLFNTYGEVIGITSAKYSNNGSSSEATIEGIGFAIPVNDVIDIITDIMEYGYVTGKPNLGILVADVDSAAQRYGIPAGAEVLAALEGSCADKSGLQAGDIITALNGETVNSYTTLQDALKKFRAGDEVTLSVFRAGATLDISMTLDETTQERSDALEALKQEYNSRQQTTTQQPSGNTNPGYGYDFTWPFGW